MCPLTAVSTPPAAEWAKAAPSGVNFGCEFTFRKAHPRMALALVVNRYRVLSPRGSKFILGLCEFPLSWQRQY